jgi:hypothetical protein
VDTGGGSKPRPFRRMDRGSSPATTRGWLIVRERRGEGSRSRFGSVARLRVPAAGPYSYPQVRSVVWPPPGELVATHEHGAVRVRRATDLAEVGVLPNVGTGAIAAGGGGRWLAALSEGSVYVRGFPGLERRGLHTLDRGGFEYFHVDEMAADPAGARLAVSDDGGRDETAMAMVLRSGEPQVTLIDAEQGIVLGAIERGAYVHRLAWDPWRSHWITITSTDVGIWSAAGEPVGRFRLDPTAQATALAVGERWIATAARQAHNQARIDLWEPATLTHLASMPLAGGIAPEWIVASPDGRLLLTPDIPVGRDYPIRVWSVQE